MGLLSDFLRQRLAQQVAECGLVVWYDPQGDYRGLAADLTLPETTLVRYGDSFFALRNQVEPLLGGLEPPRLVVYVPLDQAETHHALAELEVAGVVLKPGAQPPSRNTRLSLVARRALAPILGDAQAAEIEKQVEAGKLTLADLDRLADVGPGGVVSVLFGTGLAHEVALAFLAHGDLDGEIAAKQAMPELSALLGPAFGLELPADGTPAALRARLARHLLASDLMANLQGSPPSHLATVKTADGRALDACLAVASAWRLRRDLRDSYVAQAGQVEKQLGLAAVKFTLDQLSRVETFASVERALQSRVEEALLAEATDDLIEMAQARQSSFWAECQPEVQARWALMAAAGQVIREADRIELALKDATVSALTLFDCYAGTEPATRDAPWCLLDTHHRHMERRCHTFDFVVAGGHESLEKLVARARDRYMQAGNTLAERFLRAYSQAGFKITGLLRQVQTFEQLVKPHLTDGKAAYFWVDALRYEMARELAGAVEADFTVELQAAVGTAPTVTEIGMAALLPGAQGALAIIPAGEGALALRIGDTVIKDRKDRIAYLKAHAGVLVADVKLDELLPSPRKKVRDVIRDAGLVVVTSQEIDALAEGDNIPLARRIMDEVLHELRRAFRVLADLGVKTIVVAADHGYLFGEQLGIEMKIDAPGGESVDLHRRVWVGRGGNADAAYLRAPLEEFGLGGGLEIAAPWNFACFKVKGGASAYFHGGLSPQELIIPVMTLAPKLLGVPEAAGAISWTLVPGSAKISTRFFSVLVKGTAAGLFDLTPPRVRVEVRAGGKPISVPVSASYGFDDATGDVQLRLSTDDPHQLEEDTVTVMIAGETAQKTATVDLLDANAGTGLAHFEIPLTIAI
jgi:hypothetical protein